MLSSTDHVTGATGKTPTVTLSKNGAAFASPAGAVTELANGWYKVAGNATDSSALGPLLLYATATGCDPSDEAFEVVAYDPDATSLGLSLAKTTNLTGFNDLSAAQVNTEADTALADVGLTTTITGRIDAAVSTRLATTGYTAPVDVSANVAAIKTVTDQFVFTVANRVDAGVIDKTGFALTSGERDSIADAYLDRTDGVETGVTPRQALRYIGAMSGDVSGAGTGTEVFVGLDSVTPRITFTVDEDGNRTADYS